MSLDDRNGEIRRRAVWNSRMQRSVNCAVRGKAWSTCSDSGAKTSPRWGTRCLPHPASASTPRRLEAACVPDPRGYTSPMSRAWAQGVLRIIAGCEFAHGVHLLPAGRLRAYAQDLSNLIVAIPCANSRTTSISRGDNCCRFGHLRTGERLARANSRCTFSVTEVRRARGAPHRCRDFHGRRFSQPANGPPG